MLSEVALLMVTDDGDETWRLRRLSGSQAAQDAGGHLSAHFAKSFILATWVRPLAPARPKGTRSVVADAD